MTRSSTTIWYHPNWLAPQKSHRSITSRTNMTLIWNTSQILSCSKVRLKPASCYSLIIIWTENGRWAWPIGAPPNIGENPTSGPKKAGTTPSLTIPCAPIPKLTLLNRLSCRRFPKYISAWSMRRGRKASVGMTSQWDAWRWTSAGIISQAADSHSSLIPMHIL